MNLFDAPCIAAHGSLAAPLRGLQILNASRIAVLLGESIQTLGDGRNVRAEPSDRTLGMKLERGGLHAKKIGDADAFGFYERTPSLPYAISEDPGSSFTPTSMRRSETGFPPPRE